MIDGQLLGGQRRDHARPYRATSNMKAESFALLSPELISRFLLEGYFFFWFYHKQFRGHSCGVQTLRRDLGRSEHEKGRSGTLSEQETLPKTSRSNRNFREVDVVRVVLANRDQECQAAGRSLGT